MTPGQFVGFLLGAKLDLGWWVLLIMAVVDWAILFACLVIGAMVLAGTPSRKKGRWLKWAGVGVLFLGFASVALYLFLFIRVVPPRSVRVVDAITGKPLSGMNVCIQAVSDGWSKQALQSELKTTGSGGRALFGMSILKLELLQSLDGYSIQVTDPASEIKDSCGPDVGLNRVPDGSEVAGPFINARRDGSEHFPVELVAPTALPGNTSGYPFMRGLRFRYLTNVSLIPSTTQR